MTLTIDSGNMISIHAPREGGDLVLGWLWGDYDISIHAPREGGDWYICMVYWSQFISIHAPREGGDISIRVVVEGIAYFNPRPPRGGRRRGFAIFSQLLRISIHAPREGGDTQFLINIESLGISIHAPREGGDCPNCGAKMDLEVFQSTPPARGAT